MIYIKIKIIIYFDYELKEKQLMNKNFKGKSDMLDIINIISKYRNF